MPVFINSFLSFLRKRETIHVALEVGLSKNGKIDVLVILTLDAVKWKNPVKQAFPGFLNSFGMTEFPIPRLLLMFNRTIILLISCLTFILIPSANAQNSLKYYLEKAYELNPSIRSSRNEIKINSLNKQLILSQYSKPVVALTSNYIFAPFFNSNGKIISTTGSPEAIGYEEALSNGGLYSMLFNVGINLFNSKTIEAFQKEFDASSDRTNYEINAIKHQIDYDITAQYLKCLQQLMLFNINSEIIKTVNDELSVVKTLVESGIGKQTDYMQLQIEAENLRLNSKLILGSYFNELVQLNKLTGISDTSFKALEPTDLNFTERKSVSNFILQYRLDSLKVIASQASFETKYNPALSAIFNTGLNAVQLTDIQRKFGLSAGLNFSWVLFDGDQKSLNRQKSDISLSTVDYNRTNFTIIRENALSISLKQIELNRSILSGITTQIISYQKLMKAFHQQLSSGQLSVIDYLTSLKNFFELRKAEVSAQINLQSSINEYTYWNW